MAKTTLSVCSACGRLNRVDLERAQSSRGPVCGACGASLPVHGAVTEVSAEGLAKLIGKSPLPVVVDFWAPWCGPCRTFGPTFAEASLRLAGQAVLVKLNTESFPEAGSAFGIRGIPTVVLFNGGQEIRRQSGVLPLPNFLQWVAGRA